MTDKEFEICFNVLEKRLEKYREVSLLLGQIIEEGLNQSALGDLKVFAKLLSDKTELTIEEATGVVFSTLVSNVEKN